MYQFNPLLEGFSDWRQNRAIQKARKIEIAQRQKLYNKTASQKTKIIGIGQNFAKAIPFEYDINGQPTKYNVSVNGKYQGYCDANQVDQFMKSRLIRFAK